MDPNVPFQVYWQTSQSFIQYLTFVCTIVIALATLVSLVFTVITAIIGSSVYKLNKDLREDHARIKESITENIVKLRQLKVETIDWIAKTGSAPTAGRARDLPCEARYEQQADAGVFLLKIWRKLS